MIYILQQISNTKKKSLLHCYIIQISALLMKLFQGLTQKTARIKTTQTEQGSIFELTTTILLCFGLMTDPRIQFKPQSLRILRQKGSSKRYFIKAELKCQLCFRKIIDQYQIKIVEEKKWNLEEINQNQFNKLPLVCLKNNEGSNCKILAEKLEQHKVEYIFTNEKLFVDRKDQDVLDRLQIQLCQMDGMLFSLYYYSPDSYISKISGYLNQHDAYYEIRSQLSNREQKVIEWVVEIVSQDKYQLNQTVQDIEAKRYICKKIYGTALLAAKFKQLGLEFEFVERKHFRRFLIAISSPNLRKKHGSTLYPDPNQQQPYWLPQDYAAMLEKFIVKIQKTDFTNISYFFSTSPNQYTLFEKDLLFIADNWNIYSSQLEDRMKELQDIIDFKVFTIQDFQLIFPNMQRIVKRIELRTGYFGQKKNVLRNVTDDITDTLYIHFFQQLQARTLRHSPFYVMDESNGMKMLLADVIASKIQYEAQSLQNSYWQDIFNRIRLHVKRIAAQSKQADEKASNDQRAEFQFTNNIEKERLIDLGCISCCPIFYTDHNIYDPLVNKTPIELVSKITQLSDLQNDVKDKICYLLNNEGGVILFDVARKYRDYIPQGEIFSKKDQEAYIQKLEALIQTISPKPVIRENIEISFVPLVKNPILNPIKQKIQAKRTENSFENVYYIRPYVEGMFVTRIKVKPTMPWKTYYWTNGEKVIVPQKVNSLTFKAMQGRKIHKYMADKFRQHYIPQDLTEQQKQIRELLAPRVSCFHPGKCTEPDAGLPIYQLKAQKQTEEDPDTKYAHMSLLIARKIDHQIIKQRLRRRGIDCQIVNLYSKNSFKAATNSAAIYHNVRFDYLLSEISYNRDFQFAGRYAMVIFISQFLKISEYKRYTDFNEKSFINLQEWVKNQHPDQEIRFWGYHNGDCEQFYLESQSRKSTVLMYYVMTQYREKCVFKNPKNFDKLTAKQKSERIKVYYPRKPRKCDPFVESSQVEVQRIMHVEDVQRLQKEQESTFWHDYLVEQLKQEYKQTLHNMGQSDREFQ